MKQTSRRWPLLLLVAALGFLGMLATISGCSSGSSVTPPPDGDLDEEEEEEVAGRCEDGTLGCSQTRAIICEARDWVTLADCADEGLVCERGRCVEPPEDGDQDTDSESEADGDVELPPDTTPPGIASTSPSNGATEVPTNLRKILINFTEPIIPVAFVLRRDVVLTGGCRAITFSGQITPDSLQIELTLLDYLESGRVYTVTMNPGRLRDAEGNVFEGYTFAFTVTGEPEGECEDDPNEGPKVSETYPYDGEMGVDTDIEWIRVIFSRNMRLLGWDSTQKLHLVGDDSHAVSFTPSWNENNTILSIRLLEPLHEDADYTVTLDAGLRDTEDRELGAVSFWFSTRPAPPDGDIDEVDGDEEGSTDGDDDTEITPPNTGLLVRTARSDCANLPDPIPAPVLESEWLASTTPGAVKLRVRHHNLVADACLTGISAVLQQQGHGLTITETIQNPAPCLEDCLRDVEHDIDLLVPASYSVTLWPDGAETPLTLEVNPPL